MTNDKPIISPILGLGLAILAVSAASILIRMAQQDAPSLVIAAYRMGFAALLLAPAALSRHWEELRALSWKTLGGLALSGAFLALHFAAWITSLEHTSVAISSVLVTTTPLWVALLSTLALGERPPRGVVLGLAAALAGGVIVALSQTCIWGGGRLACDWQAGWDGRGLWGSLLALLGAVFASGYLLIGRRMRASLSLATYTFVVYGAAAVCLWVAVLVSGLPVGGYPLSTYGWMLALAVFPQLIGHSTYNWALRYVSATVVSVSLLGEPIGASLLAVVLLGEIPGAVELMGGALILVGIFLAARSEPV